MRRPWQTFNQALEPVTQLPTEYLHHDLTFSLWINKLHQSQAELYDRITYTSFQLHDKFKVQWKSHNTNWTKILRRIMWRNSLVCETKNNASSVTKSISSSCNVCMSFSWRMGLVTWDVMPCHLIRLIQATSAEGLLNDLHSCSWICNLTCEPQEIFRYKKHILRTAKISIRFRETLQEIKQ